jgi:hypothetical protein
MGCNNLGASPPNPPKSGFAAKEKAIASICSILAAEPLFGGFGGLAPQVVRTPNAFLDT